VPAERWSWPPSRPGPRDQPQAGLIRQAGEIGPRLIQHVSSRPLSFVILELFILFYLLILVHVHLNRTDTDVLSLVPLKRVALGARGS
jgi:hypothetical protein